MIESFRVGRSLPQLVGAGRALNRQLPPAGPAVAHTQAGVGQSKLGIELDRALEQRNPGIASTESRRPRGAVRLQRLDGCRRRFFERLFMCLDRREGLSDARPERTCHSAERAEHVFLAGNLRLLRIENLPRPAIGRPQPQDVLVAETGNRSLDDGGAAASLADLQRDGRRQPRIGRLAHHRDHAANALIGQHVEERRLLQLDDQA